MDDDDDMLEEEEEEEEEEEVFHSDHSDTTEEEGGGRRRRRTTTTNLGSTLLHMLSTLGTMNLNKETAADDDEDEAENDDDNRDDDKKERKEDERGEKNETDTPPPATMDETLCQQLRREFGLADDERFEAEYACWLLDNILMKGRLYVTEAHVLFYAYLPLAADGGGEREGFLTKQGSLPLTSARHWTVLQGSRLSFYENSESIYFPQTSIDLKRVGDVTPVDQTKFKLHKRNRDDVFDAGSEENRKEWMKAIKISMKQAKNDGNVIQVKIPLWTITDITRYPMFQTKAIRISAMDQDDGAIDDYVFLYFRDQEKAFRLLNARKSKTQPPLQVEAEREDDDGFCIVSTKDTPSSQPSSQYGPPAGAARSFWPSFLPFGAETPSPTDDEKSGTSLFGLPPEEELLKELPCWYFVGSIPQSGSLYIFDQHICFNRNFLPKKIIIPISDIELPKKRIARSLSLSKNTIILRTVNQQEILFDLHNRTALNGAMDTINRQWNKIHNSASLPHANPSTAGSLINTKSEVRDVSEGIHEQSDPRLPHHVTLLTIGSRGDVQPLVALARALARRGHHVRIVSHPEFRSWVESFHIEFRSLGGNPAELLALMAQNSFLSPTFVREAVGRFYGWFDSLLEMSWTACQGSEALVASPYSFVGCHIAEALDIPFISYCPFPWTRTRDFPHPLMIPEYPMGGRFNLMTYSLLDSVLWYSMSRKINAWRTGTLRLQGLYFKEETKAPTINCFSKFLIRPPSDWQDWVHINGFFFLENSTQDWTPPPDLLEFLGDRDANDAERKVVYIGFGSVVLDNPNRVFEVILEAVKRARVRAIVAKGWSERKADTNATADNEEDAATMMKRTLPKDVYLLPSVPHDWLFERISGVVHHGGAGTTAAGLRAGIPTAIKPFFGDQFFWAERVSELGAGCALRELTVEKLSAALVTLTTDTRIIQRASDIGSRIRAENGIEDAIRCLDEDTNRAKQWISERRLPLGANFKLNRNLKAWQERP